MSRKFVSKCLPEAVEVSIVDRALLGKAITVPRLEWASADGLRPSALRLQALASEGVARWKGDTLRIPNEAACNLPGTLASAIGLADPAPIMVDISFQGGAITSEGSYIQTDWKLTNYQEIEPNCVGLNISWGGKAGRLQGPLFSLIDAIDGYNRVSKSSLSERVAAWGKVSAALQLVDPKSVDADPYTKSLTILQAGSFSLDVTAIGERVDDFVPVLMQRSKARTLDDDAPADDLDASPDEPPGADQALLDEDASRLLTAEDQKKFLKFFSQPGPVEFAYALRRQTFILVDPDLRDALNVVKKARAGTREEKREFVKNPRAAIAKAAPGETKEGLTTAVFVETRQYSDRVTGLGLWEPPQLPWLSKIAIQWLPEPIPVEIGGEKLDVTRDELRRFIDAVATAEAKGAPDVTIKGRTVPVVEARHAVDKATGLADLPAFQKVGDQSKPPEEELKPKQSGGQVVTLIKTNFESLEYRVIRKPRKPWVAESEIAPFGTKTKFKAHQDDGFRWLVDAWIAGWPGVLLADDMGLGKSYQALAFLAWVRRNLEIAAQKSARRKLPILIVAPTALLENWIKESRLHLLDGALGVNRADMFGAGIRKFRNTDPAATELLDWRKIEEHDWVLTTYETLADYQTSFARILFSVAVFDEIQKIKDPGTLNSASSKSVNAEFALGLSGTPIENRIEDLWSVMDRVSPGLLGDLKVFSTNYKNATIDQYRSLSEMLMKPVDGAPAIVLRRMKDDVLEGLPPKTIERYRDAMPDAQAKRYEEIVQQFSGAQGAGRGAMLEYVQKVRGVSLFPGDPRQFDLTTKKGVADWKGQSARVVRTFDILHKLEAAGQRGLVFLEHRGMQSLLAQAISTEFGIEPPMIINGATPGSKRPLMVDDFERRHTKFDLMILSPKAAGIGLTILTANHVIHLSCWWNPAIEDQCNDRVYRIGAKLPVTIHIPMALHPRYGEKSFDVQLDELVGNKRKISRGLLMPPVADSDVDAFKTAA